MLTTWVNAFPASSASHLFVGQCVDNGTMKHRSAYNDSTCWQVDTRWQRRRRDEDTQGTVAERTLDDIAFVKRQTYKTRQLQVSQQVGE